MILIILYTACLLFFLVPQLQYLFKSIGVKKYRFSSTPVIFVIPLIIILLLINLRAELINNSAQWYLWLIPGVLSVIVFVLGVILGNSVSEKAVFIQNRYAPWDQVVSYALTTTKQKNTYYLNVEMLDYRKEKKSALVRVGSKRVQTMLDYFKEHTDVTLRNNY